MKTKRHVPMELDPKTFAARVGYSSEDLEDDPGLRAAERAYSNYSRALKELHERERVIHEDTTKTPEAKALLVDKIANKSMDPVISTGDSTRKGLIRDIESIEGDINRAFRSTLNDQERAEIRAHVKSLSDRKRREFLAAADDDTIAAVLTGKPFLSNMGEAEAKTLRHNAIQKRFPQELKRKKMLERSVDMLDAGWQMYMGEIGKLRDPLAEEKQRRIDASARAAGDPIDLDDNE